MATACRHFVAADSDREYVLSPAYNQTPHEKNAIPKRVSEGQSIVIRSLAHALTLRVTKKQNARDSNSQPWATALSWPTVALSVSFKTQQWTFRFDRIRLWFVDH